MKWDFPAPKEPARKAPRFLPVVMASATRASAVPKAEAISGVTTYWRMASRAPSPVVASVRRRT